MVEFYQILQSNWYPQDDHLESNFGKHIDIHSMNI